MQTVNALCAKFIVDGALYIVPVILLEMNKLIGGGLCPPNWCFRFKQVIEENVNV